MKLIKGYTQWLNEEATAQAPTSGTAGTSGPGAKPEGYTLKSNGVAYKYPFADDKSHSLYAYWAAPESAITDSGASQNEADLKKALAKIMPIEAGQRVAPTQQELEQGKTKPYGKIIIDSVDDALELHAKMGWKRAVPLEQMAALAATDAVKLEVDGLKKYYQDIKDYDGYDKKGRVAQWNKNWPTIWKEQCTKAKMPWTQATATPAAPATGNG